ncbi:hypothetical protein Lesp02_77850 [Lentzea sp. NBRC 105346]|uniref:hypothetical protein n=1 Tax=Lentzea sp. NBRC 105346 TaxID=3032205 RepID=UPI0024A24818|nr:hypothetical protein [Lentzea sp. NBRC 105346]GLZ35598.1 hypothetical protein Lesp02_77850 [Lentzea sp. NBRC 105346]
MTMRKAALIALMSALVLGVPAQAGAAARPSKWSDPFTWKQCNSAQRAAIAYGRLKTPCTYFSDGYYYLEIYTD